MLVPLESSEGRVRLQRACNNLKYQGRVCAIQKEIVESFRKQRGNTVCGLASLAIVLTARNLAAITSKEQGKTLSLPEEQSISINLVDPSSDCFVDEDDVFPMAFKATTRSATTIVSNEKIRTLGMTLEQARALAEALPTTKRAITFSPATTVSRKMIDESKTKEAVNSNELRRNLTGPSDLRDLLVEFLSEPPLRTGIVLNYHMSTLGQVPFGGHLSPVAAYDASSDSILVMDVWHTQTEPVWASIETVWKSILEIDTESLEPRGLLRVVHD